MFNGGTLELFLKPDVATGITVSSGGSYLLSGNVSGTDTTLEAGSFMALESPKATLSGSLIFNGAATLDLTVVTSAGFGTYTSAGSYAVISGFGAGDIIDETLISSATATLVTVTSAGQTFETISGGLFPETFVFDGTAIAANIAMVSDGGTGVELVYEAACFATGTMILTDAGERAIDQLRVGENVLTASGEARPIQWIGYRSLDLRRHPRPHDVMPVRIQAHAVAENVPSRDLIVSPDHALFLNGALIPVRYLLNGASIAQEAAERITWWHVELETHDLILAEGMPTESYLDTGNRSAFTNAGAGHVIQAHPDFSRGVWAAEACAPLVTDGAALAKARDGLLARLPELGHVFTADAGLQLAAGGEALEPQAFNEWLCVVMPAGSDALQLRSQTFQPAALESLGSDWRTLGVAVAALRIDGEEIALDAAVFATGWVPAADGLRWSNGDATLLVPSSSVVEIRLAHFQRYAVIAEHQTATRVAA